MELKYEDINVDALRSSLNSCKNAINHNITDSLSSSITGSDVWFCGCTSNLNQALNSIRTYYSILESKLDNFLRVTDYIEKYKNLQDENVKLAAEIETLKPSLYYSETYTPQVWDDDLGKYVNKKVWDSESESYVDAQETRTVTNSDVARQINEKQEQITANEGDMRNLDANILVM